MPRQRPAGTGGYLTNEFGPSKELPRGYDASVRGYVRLRAMSSGPVTNRQLRTAFGGNSVTNEMLAFHLERLQEQGLVSHRAIRRGKRYDGGKATEGAPS